MATGYFSLVLHAHLPFVRHPEDPTVMEEQWLYEAITGTYLPLLQMFEGLIADHVPYRVHGVAVGAADHHADRRPAQAPLRRAPRQADRAHREGDRAHQARAALPAAGAHVPRPLPVAAPHLAQPRGRPGARVPAAAGGRARRGHHVDRDARVLPADGPQLGHHPRPGPRRRRPVREALRPPPARHVAGRMRLRPGRRRAAARGGHPLLLRRHARHPVRRSPPGVRRLRARCTAPAASPRSAATWSRRSRCGAPRKATRAIAHYRDFYRDIGFDLPIDYIEPYIHPEGHRVYTGIKYHAITHNQLHDKWVYDPDIARGKAGLHASHFRGNREKQVQHLRGAHGPPADHRQPVRRRAVRPLVVRGAACSSTTCSASCTTIRASIETITPGDYLERHDTNQVATPCASSWGFKGYNDYWLNETNAWTYRHLHVAGERMVELARRHPSADALTDARAQPGGARADAGAVERLDVHHEDRDHRPLRHQAHQPAHPAVQQALRRPACDGERATSAGSPTSRAGTTSSRTSTTASTLAEPAFAPTAPRASVAAEGSVRRVRVRAVREDRRPGRRRGRAAQGAARAGHRRARRDAAVRGHAVERSRGARRLHDRADVVGRRARRACASASCRAATCRSTPRVQPLLRPPLPLRAARRGLPRQPGTLHVPVARLAGAVQGAGLLPRRHPLQRLADGAGAGLRQHRRVDAAAARARRPSIRSTTSPTRACSTAAACSSPASGASTTTRASWSTSAR